MLIIQDEKTKNSILKTLADPIDTEIIRVITHEAKPVSKIIEELELAASSTYRRLKNLEDMGIIRVEQYLNAEGPSNKYRANYSHIEVRYTKEETIIQVLPTNKIVEQTYSLFSGLR